MLLRQIFDPKLAQYAYLIGCQRSGEALILDPERDVDRYLEAAAAEGLRITAAAETHIHADFLSGSRELAEHHGVKLYLSREGGPDWQYEWARDGHYEVELLRDGDVFTIGNIELRAVHTPGHTPEHLSFVITDRGGGSTDPMGIATGDFVFVGDLGRPDLLETAAGEAGAREPSARRLYQSVLGFRELPEFLQVWPAHGAGSACGKALGAVPASTVGYELRTNAAIDASRRGEQDFVDSILEGQPEPPYYFADMKRLNRSGPPLLGELPRPGRRSPAEIAAALASGEIAVVDTRGDRTAFMASHLAGSLFVPLDRSFPAVAGSYLRPEQEILLLVGEERLEEAVRDLVRIGLDRVTGFAPLSLLEDAALADHLRSTPIIDFAELEHRRQENGPVILDVRGAVEHQASHVPGALNIAHTRLLPRLDEVPLGREILVHCAAGMRAAVAAAFLESRGFEVRHVDAPFATWRASAVPASV